MAEPRRDAGGDGLGQASFVRVVRGRIPTLVLTGEIDLAVAPVFTDRLADLVRAARSPVHVDLSGVAFIDSSGLKALSDADKAARDAGGQLVLVNPSAACTKVLAVTGLLDIFEVLA